VTVEKSLLEAEIKINYLIKAIVILKIDYIV